MAKRLPAVILILFLAFSGSAQQWKLKRIEAIMGVGTTNVYSDLGGARDATSLLFVRDFTFRGTRPSVYLGLRYRINPRSTVKTSLIYGFSKTEDFAGSRNENRGFSSVTQLVELTANYEFYFLPENRRLRSAAMFNRRGMINNYTSLGAYVFAGFGGTMFWPDLTVEERPGDQYKDNMGITATFPIGLGIKYIISDKWMLGYEVGYRQTLSDFLDGFKSPFSNHADIYWISTLNLSYRIPTSRKGLPIFMDREWRRAKF